MVLSTTWKHKDLKWAAYLETTHHLPIITVQLYISLPDARVIKTLKCSLRKLGYWKLLSLIFFIIFKIRWLLLRISLYFQISQKKHQTLLIIWVFVFVDNSCSLLAIFRMIIFQFENWRSEKQTINSEKITTFILSI